VKGQAPAPPQQLPDRGVCRTPREVRGWIEYYSGPTSPSKIRAKSLLSRRAHARRLHSPQDRSSAATGRPGHTKENARRPMCRASIS